MVTLENKQNSITKVTTRSVTSFFVSIETLEMFEQKQELLVVHFRYFITFMLYFLIIYIVFYILTLCSLQYLIKSTFSNQLNFNTIPYMAYYIINFSKLKYLYFGLIIALTGIPPFLLFFVKFHYLIQVSNRIGFIGFVFTFFLLFLNMLFYAQLNITKNVSFE